MTQKYSIEVGGFTISKEQKELVNKVLDSNRITYGPMTERFEREWAKLHNVKFALFCNSGTSALQVALHALKDTYGWVDGDEVIVPALTFVATVNIVLHNNMKPIFVDVEDKYFNIDPDKIEEQISYRTKAIIPVHLLGQPAQMDKIMKLAKKYHLKVIEDSCETVAATYKGKSVGSWGDIGCFSTYASHLVVTGVGGFACTNDPSLATKIKGLYNHGRDGIYHSIDDDDKDPVQMMTSRFNFTHSGYSYRGTEMESALGVGHLKRLPKELRRRNRIANAYITALKELEKRGKIQLPKIHKHATHSYMLFPIVFSDKRTRNACMKFLEERGIRTRFMMPLLNQPVMKKIFGDIEKDYPVAEKLDNTAMLIGCYPEITDEEVLYVIRTIKEFFHG